MSVDTWEEEGGSVEPMVYLELTFTDMNYLMNKAQLANTARDIRILDAFRRAFQNSSPKTLQ